MHVIFNNYTEFTWISVLLHQYKFLSGIPSVQRTGSKTFSFPMHSVRSDETYGKSVIMFCCPCFYLFKLAERSLQIRENWTTTNHVNFNKGKCQILHLRQATLNISTVWNAAPQKGDLSILVNTHLNMNQ